MMGRNRLHNKLRIRIYVVLVIFWHFCTHVEPSAMVCVAGIWMEDAFSISTIYIEGLMCGSINAFIIPLTSEDTAKVCTHMGNQEWLPW